MDKVYITGHRNPDTDSIVSAMAYAALKNALGQRQYCAARLGQISDETKAGDGDLAGAFVSSLIWPPRRYHQPGLADDADGPDLRTACGQ